MSDPNFQHAVTHKLYLELSGKEFHVVITDKNDRIVDSEVIAISDQMDLVRLIDEDSRFQSIYSKVFLVSSGCRFVTMPQSVTNPADKARIYNLSYASDVEQIPLEDHIGIQLTVYYEQIGSLISLLNQKFANTKMVHELAVLHDAITPHLSDQVNNLVIHISSESLLIMAFTQGKMIFCNHFEQGGQEDIFYFVMLTLEELEFEQEFTELVILNDSEIDDLNFGDFIQTVSEPKNLFDDQSINKSWPKPLSFAIQAAIQCE